MAGTGKAPKYSENRRNGSAPQRGEWVDLGPLSEPVLGDLPDHDDWSIRTRNAWAAWRQDPVTGLYGPAERQLVLDLAYVYEQWVSEATASLAAEVRQRLDGLGLTPKGKQDRRWRLAPAADVVSINSARPARKSAAERMQERIDRRAAGD